MFVLPLKPSPIALIVSILITELTVASYSAPGLVITVTFLIFEEFSSSNSALSLIACY